MACFARCQARCSAEGRRRLFWWKWSGLPWRAARLWPCGEDSVKRPMATWMSRSSPFGPQPGVEHPVGVGGEGEAVAGIVVAAFGVLVDVGGLDDGGGFRVEAVAGEGTGEPAIIAEARDEADIEFHPTVPDVAGFDQVDYGEQHQRLVRGDATRGGAGGVEVGETAEPEGRHKTGRRKTQDRRAWGRLSRGASAGSWVTGAGEEEVEDPATLSHAIRR